MTEQEITKLQEQNELLATNLKAREGELAAALKAQEDLKKAATNPLITPEALKALQDKAAQADALAAEKAAQQAAADDNALKAKFPLIKDISVLGKGTLAEREARANDLIKALNIQAPAPGQPAKTGEPAPANPWAGTKTPEALAKEAEEKAARDKKMEAVETAVKNGDPKAALAACMAAQPNAVANLSKGLGALLGKEEIPA